MKNQKKGQELIPRQTSPLVIVTGGNSGIGLATLKKFQLERAIKPESEVNLPLLWSLSRGLPTAKQFLSRGKSKEKEKEKEKSKPFNWAKLDLESLEQKKNLDFPKELTDLKKILKISLKESRPIHLIHCAGKLTHENIEDFKEKDWNQVVKVHLTGPLILTQLILPYMSKGSSIIVVGSTLGLKAIPGAMNYVITKHAQVGLVRSLCQDLVGKEIHSVYVAPGFTDTEMLRDHIPDKKILHQITEMVCFKRLIHPEEMGELIYQCTQLPLLNGAILDANLGQINR